MSLYGSNYYNLFTYGSDSLVDYSAAPIYSTSTDYNQITVFWRKPGGDWDTAVLVRNKFGFPTTPDDGEAIVTYSQEEHPAQVEYVDQHITGTVHLADNQVYYYSVFVKATLGSQWYRAGNTLSVSVKNYGTPDQMYGMVPIPYKNSAFNTDVLSGTVQNSDLYNFLKIFAFEHDLFKSTAENVKNRYDVDRLNGRLLPAMMNQFGIQFETEMGLAQGRRMLKNIAEIYLTKGTARGIKKFTSAFTGYSCDISPYKNMMLTLEDCSFENTAGNWVIASTGAPAVHVTGASESPVVPPYEESTSPSMFPNKNAGVLKSGDSVLCGASEATGTAVADIRKCIPVTEGTSYTFSAYFRSSLSTSTASVAIYYFDKEGTYINEIWKSPSSIGNTSWTRKYVTMSAPTGAMFAAVGLTSNDVYYADACQFEEGSSATDYVDSRRIDLYLTPNRTNLIPNPSFESATTNWSANGCTFALDASGAVDGSSSSLKLNSTSTFATATSDILVPVTAGSTYTLSAYVKGPATDVARARITYSSGGVPSYWAISSDVTLSPTEWQRVSVTVTVPAGNTAINASFEFDTASGRTNYLDAVLLELDDTVNTYFDGSTGYNQVTDLLWEDNDDINGKSYYYTNRSNVTRRLYSAIEEYMPFGSTWAITHG